MFKEYGEVVLTVGSACRLTNRNIFGGADLACGVSLLPGEQGSISSSEAAVLSGLPAACPSEMCRADLLLVFSRVSMGVPLPLASLEQVRTVPGVRAAIVRAASI